MKKANIQLESLVCPSCVQKIESAVKSLNGVDKDTVKIMYNSSKAKFNFDDSILQLADVEKAITALGFEVIKSSAR